MWRCHIVTRNNLCPRQGPQGPGQAHLCPGPAPEHNLQNFVLAAGHLVLDSCDLALRTQIGCLNITYQNQVKDKDKDNFQPGYRFPVLSAGCPESDRSTIVPQLSPNCEDKSNAQPCWKKASPQLAKFAAWDTGCPVQGAPEFFGALCAEFALCPLCALGVPCVIQCVSCVPCVPCVPCSRVSAQLAKFRARGTGWPDRISGRRCCAQNAMARGSIA